MDELVALGTPDQYRTFPELADFVFSTTDSSVVSQKLLVSFMDEESIALRIGSWIVVEIKSSIFVHYDHNTPRDCLAVLCSPRSPWYKNEFPEFDYEDWMEYRKINRNALEESIAKHDKDIVTVLGAIRDEILGAIHAEEQYIKGLPTKPASSTDKISLTNRLQATFHKSMGAQRNIWEIKFPEEETSTTVANKDIGVVVAVLNDLFDTEDSELVLLKK